MVPFLEWDAGGPWLWFSSRDDEGRSHSGRVRFRPEDGEMRPELTDRALLEPGPLGAFDDSGAMGSCIVRRENVRYLYYIGWSRGVTVPFYTFVGCAVSRDDTTFRRVSPAPVVGRSAVDPYLATSPWVMHDGGRWRMWYASCTAWDRTDDGTLHRYHIKYAESHDGVDWRPTGRVCIDYASSAEIALARPCVIRDPDRYRMWFSHRGSRYRIGYAESDDGIEWDRRDAEGGLEVSREGFDSEMVEYPFVFDHEGSRYMLYNGNGYGETGVGLAVLEP
jgi:hypothetical protein